MEVKMISKENIKPSSPTPDHLKTYKFSLLDNLIYATYVPLVLFYPSNGNTDVSRVLKKSLSQTLARFYPLAGKVKDEFTIECDDEGVKFVETRVGGNLKDFLQRPDLTLIRNLLPCNLDPLLSPVGANVANVQLNVFECGGIALGSCILHKTLDGYGQGTFLKAWAEATRSSSSAPEMSPSIVAGASLFPAQGTWLQDEMKVLGSTMFKLGNAVTKRFVFNASAIARLKAQAATSSLPYPSRVEVATACLWKSFVKASTQRQGFERPSLVLHAVNIRGRASPPIPEHVFGNLFYTVGVKHCKATELGMKGMVGELRKTISGVDDEFIRKMTSDQGRSVMEGQFKEMIKFGSDNGLVDHFLFSSWCKFGFYNDLDFGWGTPLWVCTCAPNSGSLVMNVVTLVDTRSGDGVEAWVTLDEQDMAIMETDHHLLALASVDPNPLLY